MKQLSSLLAIFLTLLLAVFLVSCLEEAAPIGGDPLSRDTVGASGETESETDGNSPYVKAMDFTVYDENGTPVKLSDFKGQPVVLNFWATWCYYCVMELPDFDAAAKAYPDVAFLMVNVTDGQAETKEDASAFIASEGFAFPVYYDLAMNASLTYGVSSLPMTVFINADGEIVTYAVGMLTRDRLEAGIGMIR